MTDKNTSSDLVVEKLRDAMVELTAKQFDQLVVFLLRELGPESTTEFVPGDASSAVDIEVSLDHPFVDATYGVRLEQLPPSELVPADIVSTFCTNLRERNLNTGVFITTGGVTDAARTVAGRMGVSVLDGEELARLLVTHELGFDASEDTITLDEAFWELFRGPKRTATVPSIEVPQADSIDRLDQTLQAIDAGHHEKSAIAAAIEEISGDLFDPRQADYYGTAGWLLGFLHKDLESKGMGGRGRWGITRRGKTYLSHRTDGNDSRADAILHEQIRQIEIVRRILQALRDAGVMRREDITALVGKETELGGTTVPRRTLTLVSWLDHLPEIETAGRGAGQEIYYQGDGSTEVADGESNTTKHSTSSTNSTPSRPIDTNDPVDEGSILDDVMSSFNLSETEK